MNANRREFLRNLGSKAASVTAAVATPAAAYAVDFGAELKKLSGQFNRKLDQAVDMIGSQMGQVSDQVDAVAVKQASQEAMLHLLFLLVIISFLIDEGSVAWMLIQ